MCVSVCAYIYTYFMYIHVCMCVYTYIDIHFLATYIKIYREESIFHTGNLFGARLKKSCGQTGRRGAN